MASNSKIQPTWKEISKDPSNVAVYRWVIFNGKELLNIHPANGVNKGDDPPFGVWISKDTSRKDYTYIARLSSSSTGWKATFGCASSDGDILEALEILDLNDYMRWQTGFECNDEVGGILESGPSQEAKKAPDKQIEKLGRTPERHMRLDIPSQHQGGTRDDNGNDLLRFSIIQYPDGFEGTQQIQDELWWAKKEVPGKRYTVLTDAEVIRLKFDGKLPHVDRDVISYMISGWGEASA